VLETAKLSIKQRSDIVQIVLGTVATILSFLLPPHQTGSAIAIYPLILTLVVLFHFGCSIRGHDRFEIAASYLLYLLACLYWVVVLVNGTLPIILAPAFLAFIGLNGFNRRWLLPLYGGATIMVVLWVAHTDPSVDLAVATRSVVSALAVLLILVMLQQALIQQELTIDRLNRAQKEREHYDDLLLGAMQFAGLDVYDENVDSGDGFNIHQSPFEGNVYVGGGDRLACVAPEQRELLRANLEVVGRSTEFRFRHPGNTEYGWFKQATIKEYLDSVGDLHRVGVSQSIQAEIDIRQELASALESEQKASDTLKQLAAQRNIMLGMIAHELRTPASSISMLAATTTQQEWSSQQQVVLEQSNQLLTTIDDMRLLLNPDQQRPLRLEQAEIAGFNTVMEIGLASIANASNVELRFCSAFPNELRRKVFVTDTYRVKTAVTNCVRNACLHAFASEVRVVNRIVTDTAGYKFIEWVVIDNGVGIDESNRKKIFKLGERASASTDGSGFGLYIAKVWLSEIGGDVYYTPGARRGSRFHIRAPLDLVENPAIVSQTQPAEVDSDAQELSTLKVLFVEDDALLRMLGQKLAEQLFGEVVVASDGQAGLELFEQGFDLILTDYFMPNLSGREMISEIRSRGYSGVIIGVTAATLGQQSEELLESGADLVISKPLTLEKLQAAIVELRTRLT
jgi:signal transduction histidine kinase